MKVFGRRRHLGLAVVAAAMFVVVGLLQVGVSAATSAPRATSINLTEEDYFNTPGQIAALAAYAKKFEAAHPGVTITREYVPFANLDTKLLTQAAGQDRSEEHTSELQSLRHLVCRLLLEKKT